jgi:steroid delta-isomerase-like uncharacterized protein
MSEANTMIVRRAVDEIWNRGNFALIDDLAASDVVVHMSSAMGDIHGPEGIKEFYSALRAGFPDIHFTIEDQISDADKVVTRWSAQATHTGAFQGIPATGKTICLVGIDIDRIANGKVVECWPVADELSLLQQLGVVATPEMAER